MSGPINNYKKTTTTTENCVLDITIAGSGPILLVVIPGGHGKGSTFCGVLEGLTNANRYTVATFDRRGHGASRFTPSGVEITEMHNPATSARDVHAIITHLGFEKACVFGSSMGGIIALQFAIQFPQYVDKLIVHEAPTMVLLPGDEGIKWIDWAFSVFQTYRMSGPRKAILEFLSMTVGWKSKASGEGAEIPPPQIEDEIEMDRDHEWWFEYEFMLTVYTPNLLELKRHLRDGYKDKMSIAVTMGKESGNAPYARTTYVHRDILGCRHFTWPGGHLLYAVDPKGFVKTMLDTLEKLDKKE